MNDTAASRPSLIGRYEIQRELGRGAMGVVYEATDPLLGRKVALKTIRLGFTVTADERAQFEQRFFSEARAVARLSHPAIVGVHDVGQESSTGDLFIALEYLRGRTLTDVVHENGALDWRDAMRIVERLAGALHHAHENGIVHRDVKPDNVMLLDSGEPKLMDFGIAKVEATQLTVAGQVFGTPRYMSPEQALGQPADARSDLFALGSVAYFLLTCRHAFGAPTIPLIIAQVVQEDPVAPSAMATELPDDVDRVLGRMLAKKPQDRYPDGRSVAEDVDDLLAGRPLRHAGAVPVHWKQPAPDDDAVLGELLLEDARPANPTVPRVVPSAAGVERATVRTAPARAPRRKWLLLAGAIAGAVLLAAGWMFWPADESRPAAPRNVGPEAPASRPGTTVARRDAADGEGKEAAPLAAERDVPLAAGNARVRFELEHSLRRGWIAISVDGTVVFEDDLEGRTSRTLRVIRTSKGRLATDVDVPAGEHTIRVEVTWDDERRARSVRATFEAGRIRHLDGKLGGVLKKNLSLDMN